jgi:hypothetical protein
MEEVDMINRQIKVAEVEKTLSHLGLVSVESMFEREDDTFITISRITHADESVEYVTHEGKMLEGSLLSLFAGHYFPRDEYAEAQEDYFQRTKALCESKPLTYLEAFHISERFGMDSPCPTCGVKWKRTSLTSAELTHKKDCPYYLYEEGEAF